MHMNPLWQATESYIDMVVFPKNAPVHPTKTEYTPTKAPPESDRLFDSTDYTPTGPSEEVGFTEGRLHRFVSGHSTHSTLIVVGMPGSGKTTTLRYFRDHMAGSLSCDTIYVDFNKYTLSQEHASTWGDSYSRGREELPPAGAHALPLDGSLSTEVDAHRLLSSDEELSRMWSWAMRPETAAADPQSVAIMHPIKKYLELKKLDPLGESPTEIGVRTELYLRLLGPTGEWSDVQKLSYQILKLQYIATQRLHPAGRQLVCIFDNLDPLEPSTHAYMIDFAVRLGLRASCKVIVAARPQTAVPWLERMATHWTYVDRLEHYGPDFIELLRRRLHANLIDLSDEELFTRLSMHFEHNPDLRKRCRVEREARDGGTSQSVILFRDLALPLSWVRAWAHGISRSLMRSDDSSGGPLPAGVPGRPLAASQIIRGVAGSSVRFGFELASKCMRSWAVPVDRMQVPDRVFVYTHANDAGLRLPSIKPGVPLPDVPIDAFDPRPRELVNAMLADRELRYTWSSRRVVDNIFHCGRGLSNDVTAKLRILQLLTGSVSARMTYKQLLRWFQLFGIEELAAREAVFQMAAPAKRLLVVDAMPARELTLLTSPNNVMWLTGVGRFYLESLAASLDYVEEMVPSSDIPVDTQRTVARPVMGVQQLRQFALQLIRVDGEQCHSLFLNGDPTEISELRRMLGGHLMSWRLFERWRPSAVRYLNSVRRNYQMGKYDQAVRERVIADTSEEIVAWEEIERVSTEESSGMRRTRMLSVQEVLDRFGRTFNA